MSGNLIDGILIDGIGNDVVYGNLIGTNAAGTAGIANSGPGIWINGGSNSSIGGTAAGQGNTIAYNADNGIQIAPATSTGNVILGNSIFANTGLGIDLNNNGVTANDAGDVDTGANNLQNFPVLTSATVISSTQVNIVGSLNSTANSQFRIEFFGNTAADGTGHGEGQTYLGFVNVTTNGSGNAAFNTTLTATVSGPSFVSATATRSNATFTTFTDTSEFALNAVAPNIAPVLDASKSPALTAINEDPGAPVGAVGTLVSSLVDFAVPAGQVDNVTDWNSGALLGIAVTAADTTNGTWFYSTNGGTTWNALGAVANNSALLLAADANTRLYFQPNANWNGPVATAITFRAWDQTSGSNGCRGFNTQGAFNGGSTAFSTATDTASLVVTAVNDAPVVDLNAAGAGQDVTTAFTEQTPVLIAPVGTLTDVDSANLSSLTVTLTARPDGNAVESLSLNAAATAAASGAGLTVSYTAGTGVLSITGAATKAVYQSILQGILYNDTSDTPTTSNRSITVVTNDGAINSATQTVTLTVAAVNDAPTATNLSAAETYTEDTALNLINIVASDVDSANITATLTLSNVAAGSLTTATSGAVTSTYNAGTGVWTASGALANVNTLLAGVTFTPALNFNSNFTIATSDQRRRGTWRSPAVKAMTGTAVNDAPVVDLNAAGAGQDVTTAFTEQTPVLIAPVGTLTDVDSANLSSLTVTLTARPDGNAVESLSLNAAATAAASGAGLTVSYTAGTGVLSITGAATKAVYQSILQGILYNDTSDTPTTSNRSITVVTNDGAINSATQTVTLTVAAVNDAPVNTLPASFTASTSAPIPLSGLSIADVDALSGTITTTLSVSSGTLSATSGGSVTVTGSGTSSIMLSGTLANVNAFLASTAPTFASPAAGSVTLTMLTNDGGNTGGAALTDSDTSTIQVLVTPIVDLNSGPTTVTTGPVVSTSTSTTNLVTNGNFGTVAAATPPAPWVESGTAGNGSVVLGAALDGRYDFIGSGTTITQPLTVPANTSNTTVTTTNTATDTTVVTTTVDTTDAITSIAFGMAWQNTDTSSPNDNRLVVSYNGVTYATFQTFQAGVANAAGLAGTWTYSNGATGPATTASVANEATGALTSITINLPAGVTASGSLAFFYTNGSTGAGSDDLAVDNVVVTSTKTTTTTVTTVTTTADTADNNWTATYTENGAAVSIADTDSSIFDGDSANMVSAAIALTNPATGDRLLVNGSAAASGTLASGIAWTRTDTAVTLSGSFTKAQYADAIELVQFENTTDTPSTTPRTITVTVNDGTFNSNTAIATINVTAVNDAPVGTEHGGGAAGRRRRRRRRW